MTANPSKPDTAAALAEAPCPPCTRRGAGPPLSAVTVTSTTVITGPGDLRDQRWLNDRITAIEDGIEAVLDIAREWTDGRNLSRLHPGTSAQDYILARVKHPLGRGVVVPLLEQSNWSNRQIAAVAGVSEPTVRRASYDAPGRGPVLGADGKVYPPRTVTAVVIEPADDPGLDAVDEPGLDAATIAVAPATLPAWIALRDFARQIADIRVDYLGWDGWEAIESIETSFAALRAARDDHAGHADLEDLVVGCVECEAEGEALEVAAEATYRAQAKAERKLEREQAKARAAWILANPDAIAWRCDGCEAEFTDEAADQGQGPLYECDDCGTRFTRDGSADGDGNRCSDCNKFGGKIADLACPDCGDGGLEPVEPEAEA